MSWVKVVGITASALISFIIVGVTYYKQRQLLNAPHPGPTRPEQTRRRQCCICLKEMNSSEEFTLPCNHSFCRGCLGPLFAGTQTNCCVCREELAEHDLNLLRRRLLN